MKKKMLINLLVATMAASAMAGCGTVKNEDTEIYDAVSHKVVKEEKSITFGEIEVPKSNVEKESRELSYTIIHLTKKEQTAEQFSLKEEPKVEESKDEEPKKDESAKKEEVKKDNTKKDDAKKEESKKDDTKKDEQKKDDTKKENNKTDSKKDDTEKVEKDSDIVEKRDDTLYTTTNLNVRKGPGTNYDVVTTFNSGKKVHRVGICRNGWSQIDYDGKKYYVSSDYLTSEKPPKKQAASGSRAELAGFEFNEDGTPKLNGKMGDAGRLMIPEVGYSVALYDRSYESVSVRQAIVDANDSAEIVRIEGQSTNIADHVNQGFANMKNSVPGQTIAYIYNPDGTYSIYQCVGINRKGTYDTADSCIWFSGYELVMQTCNSAANSITLTYWESIN